MKKEKKLLKMRKDLDLLKVKAEVAADRFNMHFNRVSFECAGTYDKHCKVIKDAINDTTARYYSVLTLAMKNRIRISDIEYEDEIISAGKHSYYSYLNALTEEELQDNFNRLAIDETECVYITIAITYFREKMFKIQLQRAKESLDNWVDEQTYETNRLLKNIQKDNNYEQLHARRILEHKL